MCLTDPARVLEVADDGADAIVWSRGARRRLSLAPLVLAAQPVRPGDWVMASLGMAIETMDEADAHAQQALLDGQE